MVVDSLPDLNPPNYGDVRDPSRPILSFGWDAKSAHRAAAHSHPRAHIIFPVSGVYRAVTPEGTWLVPSGQAIWIPPRVHHEIYSHGPVSARILFVDEAYADPLPSRSGTVAVSLLLTELLLPVPKDARGWRRTAPRYWSRTSTSRRSKARSAASTAC